MPRGICPAERGSRQPLKVGGKQEKKKNESAFRGIQKAGAGQPAGTKVKREKAGGKTAPKDPARRQGKNVRRHGRNKKEGLIPEREEPGKPAKVLSQEGERGEGDSQKRSPDRRGKKTSGGGGGGGRGGGGGGKARTSCWEGGNSRGRGAGRNVFHFLSTHIVKWERRKKGRVRVRNLPFGEVVPGRKGLPLQKGLVREKEGDCTLRGTLFFKHLILVRDEKTVTSKGKKTGKKSEKRFIKGGIGGEKPGEKGKIWEEVPQDREDSKERSCSPQSFWGSRKTG